MPTYLSPVQLTRDLALRDLTDPSAGPHALQSLVDLAAHTLGTAWGCEVRRIHGERVVEVADNYDRLGFNPDAVTRDIRYTRYVEESRMLRSHASAMVPQALRALAAEPVDDILLVCPGIVFRRDAIDRLHTGTPHQLDLWRISRRPLEDADMDEMTRLLTGVLVPGHAYRSETRVHPYTLNGRQVDVDAAGEWVEVWECGLAHPAILRCAGLAGWNGLALGLGLDRFLMLRKGIPDIRLLRSTDPRVSSQMLDLSPYRPVSAMPAVTRDLSVGVGAEEDAEALGDDALRGDADAVEAVEILSETGFSELPASAIERMGMSVGQKNVLLRVTLRHLERTLTDVEANDLRDRIYRELHRGDRSEWAGPITP